MTAEMLAAGFNQLHRKTVEAAQRGANLQSIGVILAEAEKQIDLLTGDAAALPKLPEKVETPDTQEPE